MINKNIFGVGMLFLIVVGLFGLVIAEGELSSVKEERQDSLTSVDGGGGEAVKVEKEVGGVVKGITHTISNKQPITIGGSAGVDINIINDDETDEEYFKSALGIAASREVSETVIPKLIERKEKNEENVKQIIKIAKVVSSGSKRERISEELLEFDGRFVTVFERFAEKSEENVKEQVENYLEVGEVELKVDDSKILDFFESGDVEGFMDSLIG